MIPYILYFVWKYLYTVLFVIKEFLYIERLTTCYVYISQTHHIVRCYCTPDRGLQGDGYFSVTEDGI